MKNVAKNILIFLLGGAVGSLVTYKIMEEEKNRIIKEEIDDIREHFVKKTEREKILEEDNSLSQDICDNKKASIDDYVSLLEKTKYSQYSEADIENESAKFDNYKKETTQIRTEPYVISPEYFGDKEDEGYDLITLYYFNDYVLTDENDEPVCVKDTVGENALGSFGEYEEDSVFVRNDVLKADYEILLIDELYSDRVGDSD